MNKIISFFVSLVLWLLLVALQTYTIAYQGNVANAFAAPELYYSVWIVDLYLIILYYTNYYLIAPMMIRRRLFRPYIYIVIGSMLIGFLIPVVLFYAHSFSTPGTAPGQAPISLIGIVGALGVIAIGLALRSVKEWSKLEPQKKEHKATLLSLESQKAQIEELSKQIANYKVEQDLLNATIKKYEEENAQASELKQTIEELEAKAKSLQTKIDELEDVNKQYKNCYGELSDIEIR